MQIHRTPGLSQTRQFRRWDSSDSDAAAAETTSGRKMSGLCKPLLQPYDGSHLVNLSADTPAGSFALSFSSWTREAASDAVIRPPRETPRTSRLQAGAGRCPGKKVSAALAPPSALAHARFDHAA